MRELAAAFGLVLAEAEPQIRQAYLDVLPRLHAKLKGA
jgi:hypothetical protein